MMSRVSENIRKFRTEKNMKQSDLGKLLGKAPSVIANWEAGTNRPDVDSILRMCEIFEIDANTLFGWESSFLRLSELGEHIPGSSSHTRFSHSIGISGRLLDNAALDFYAAYVALDAHGKEAVNSILEVETARMNAPKLQLIQDEPETMELKHPYPRVAAGSGIDLYGEDYETIRVIVNMYTRKADYCLTVAGNSMEPRYHDEDIILVKNQDDVSFGEIGIWVINSRGFVKQKGEDRLISLNHDVPDVYLNDGDECRCVDKVVGTLDPDWIV